uniref:Uncharacterized protein n=1 Tax=Oryza glaberrima TaxID=4538 RepID=I1Q560_ORYGL
MAAADGSPATTSFKTSTRLAADCGGELSTRNARVAARTRCAYDAAAAMGAESSSFLSLFSLRQQAMMRMLMRMQIRCFVQESAADEPLKKGDCREPLAAINSFLDSCIRSAKEAYDLAGNEHHGQSSKS